VKRSWSYAEEWFINHGYIYAVQHRWLRHAEHSMSEDGQGSKKTVLVVEDDSDLMILLRYNLEEQGFWVEEAHDGEEALQQVTQTNPDLVVLDWMLPVYSGIEVCRRLRRRHSSRNLPVIMISGRTEDYDSVRALDSGADDFLVKPFPMTGLLARVRALLRRSEVVQAKRILTYGDISLDQAAHRAHRAGRPLALGPVDYRMLELFLRSPARAFTREMLLTEIWGRDIHVELRTVDVHILRLRKALNLTGVVDPIRTIRGMGYALQFDEVGSEQMAG
jgi:two-component system phosphate regulon response regulator PhoB